MVGASIIETLLRKAKSWEVEDSAFIPVRVRRAPSPRTSPQGPKRPRSCLATAVRNLPGSIKPPDQVEFEEQASAQELNNLKSTEMPKCKLLSLVMRELRVAQMQKGDILYETVSVDGLFVSTVTIVVFGPLFVYEGAPAESMKLAEHNAAEVALRALHMGTMDGADRLRQTAPAAAVGATVNKLLTDCAIVNWKNLLMESMVRHLGRGLVTGDVDVVNQGADDGKMYVGTVTCHCLFGDSYHGEPASSRKAAEQDACLAAMRSVFPVVTALAEERHAEFLAASGPGQEASPAGERLGDAKAMLNRSSQLLIGRPLKKGELEFKTVGVQGRWRSTLKVIPYGGKPFRSGINSQKPAAESDAAWEFLSFYAAEITAADEARSEKIDAEHAERKERLAEKFGQDAATNREEGGEETCS